MFTSFIITLALIMGYPACPTEDSTHCYWDASVQGNGVGTSFVAY